MIQTYKKQVLNFLIQSVQLIQHVIMSENIQKDRETNKKISGCIINIEKRSNGIQLTELTVDNKKVNFTPSGTTIIDNNHILIKCVNKDPINIVDSNHHTSDTFIPENCNYHDFRNSKNSIINIGCSNSGLQISKMTIFK